nr:hypothetical protein [Tanacetum cinerariifolium]
MSSNAEVTYSEGKVHPSDDGSQPRTLCKHGFRHVRCEDVAGYVTNVGRISHQKSSSRTLDFSLANGSEDEVSLSHATVHADYSQANEGTLRPSNAELRLMTPGHEKDGTSQPMVVRNVRKFWLELDVSDKSASTVVVMFDEPVKELLKCSADSLAAADDESRFGYVDHAGLPLALANIIEDCPEEAVDVDSESRNMTTSAEVNITKVKRLATKRSVATPSKPTEEKGKRFFTTLHSTALWPLSFTLTTLSLFVKLANVTQIAIN